MIRLNENFTKLKASYVFSDIAKRVTSYTQANPQKPVIRLGIGDVTEPLPPVCIAALHAATDEMAESRDVQGLRPGQGYAFLRNSDRPSTTTTARGCHIEADEILSPTARNAHVGIFRKFSPPKSELAIRIQSYPVYVDTQRHGRTHRSQRRWALPGGHLPRQHTREWLVPAIPSVAHRSDLSLFPQ